MNARSPYLLSSLGHFAALAAAVVFAGLNRPVLVVPGVRIVALAGGGGDGGAAAGKAATAVAPEPAVVEPAPTPPQAVEEPPRPAPKPKAKPIDKAPPERRRTAPADVRGALPPGDPGMVSKAPSSAAPAAPAAAGSGAGSGSGRGSGVGVEMEGDAGAASGYLVLLRDRVASLWRSPAHAGRTGDVTCVVYFVIARGGGQPQAVAVQSSSGASMFDRAAMRAVMEAAPLPPLPVHLGLESIAIRFTFRQTY